MQDRDTPRRDGDRITHTNVQTKEAGRRGFRPGEDVSGRRQFSGRENVTEERQHRAIDLVENV